MDKYQDFGHSHWHNSLIWGENLTNVSILGPGMIWGKGLVRSGSQSRTQQQNDALNNARAVERHVRRLELNDVEVKYLKDDARAPFILSDAKSVGLRNIRAQHASGAPTLILKDVEDFSIQQSYPLRDVRLGKVKRQQL